MTLWSPERMAGFPSPAADFEERPLDLHAYLVEHPSATFFFRAEGSGLEKSGVFPGDLLVVDRALVPREGDIVIAVVEGQFVVRRFHREGDRILLFLDRGAPLVLAAEDTELWGVIRHAIHTFR